MPNGSATLGTTAVTIVGDNPFRKKLIITNISDTAVFIGQGPLTTSTGIRLSSSGVFIDEPDSTGYIYKGAWVGVTTSASKVVTYIEDNHR